MDSTKTRNDYSSIPEFVNFQVELLDLEFEEEKKELNYDMNNPKISLLKEKGVLINNLTVSRVDTDFGSCIVEFTRESLSKEYCPILISNGDIVAVWCNEEEKCRIATGIVMYIGKKIRISLDHQQASNLDSDKTFFILKTSSEITYRRLRSALKNLMHYHDSKKCSVVVEHLFNNFPIKTGSLPPNCFDEKGKFKFINGHLHYDQKEAVLFALKQQNFVIIHGPPGTGKTTTLAEVIAQLVKMEQKVLVCAPSNIAVDTILEKLSSIPKRVLRIGKTARMMESIKSYSLDAAMSNRDDRPILDEIKADLEYCQEHLKDVPIADRNFARQYIKSLKKDMFAREEKAQRELLFSASVVLTTLVSASDDGALGRLPDNYFDVLVIDECSQAIEAACWIAIPKASKLILAGDHLQLAPTVKNKIAYDKGLGISLMERAISTIGDSCYKMLTQQFRMHSSIMTWVSRFYDNKLKADDSVANRLLKDLPHVMESYETETPLLFIDTAGCKFAESEFHGSKCNEGEADVTCVLIKHLMESGVDENVISVITPYSLQVSCINTKLNFPKVEVRTVDGFQGREKEVVIISLVRSNKEKDLGFVSDKRRLNVAVSRAKCFLAVVGDSTTVGIDEVINSLIKHIRKCGVVSSAHEFLEEIQSENFPEFMSIVTKKIKKENTNAIREKSSSMAIKKESKGKGLKVNTPNEHYSKQRITWQHPESNCQTDITVKKDRLDGLVMQQSNCVKKENYLGGCVKSLKKGSKSNVNKALRKTFEVLSCSDTDEEHEVTELKGDDKTRKTESATTASLSSNVIQAKSKTRKRQNRKGHKNLRELSFKELEENIEKDEDFKLLDQVMENNSVCHMRDCKTSVKLISHFCEYCQNKYCLSHMLPEVHGCGEVARRTSRYNFKHPVTKPGEKEKKIASIKLKKKVEELASGRKHGSKKK